MFRNYILEADLINEVPEIANYKYTGQTDFSGTKTRAEQTVSSDLINRGFKPTQLRPDLSLRTSTSAVTVDENGTISEEDSTGSLLRVVANVTALTTPVTLTLQGTNDDGTTYNTITTLTPTATGITSGVFLLAHKKYRINTDVTSPSTITYQAWLSEIKFDNLFLFKWLELILMNAGKGADNKFTDYANYYRDKYKEELTTGNFWIDETVSGNINNASEDNAVNVRFGR